MKISQNREFSFIISKFTSNGLKFIGKVDMFSLENVIKLKTDNECF